MKQAASDIPVDFLRATLRYNWELFTNTAVKTIITIWADYLGIETHILPTAKYYKDFCILVPSKQNIFWQYPASTE
jgi:hypothetical protein